MSRFKTELCNNLIELGTCKYGDRCHYAHGPTELRQVSKRHPKYRTESCKNFELTGKCPFGPRCSYVHPKPDLDSMIEQLSKYMKHTKAPKPEDSEDDSDDLSLYATTTGTQRSSSSSLDNVKPKHNNDHHRLLHHQLARPDSTTRCGSVPRFDQENYHHDSMIQSYAHGPNSLRFDANQENKENVEMILDADHAKSTTASTRTNLSNKLLPFDKISPNIHNFHAAGLPSHDILNKRASTNSNAFTIDTPKLNAQPISSQALQTTTTRTPLSSKNGNSSANSVYDNQTNLHHIHNQQYHHSLINNPQRFNLITSDQITGTQSNSYLNSISDAPSTRSNSSLSSIAAAFEQAGTIGSDIKLRLIEESSAVSRTPSTNSLTANLNNQAYPFSISYPLSDYFDKAHIDVRAQPNKQYYTGF